MPVFDVSPFGPLKSRRLLRRILISLLSLHDYDLKRKTWTQKTIFWTCNVLYILTVANIRQFERDDSDEFCNCTNSLKNTFSLPFPPLSLKLPNQLNFQEKLDGQYCSLKNKFSKNWSKNVQNIVHNSKESVAIEGHFKTVAELCICICICIYLFATRLPITKKCQKKIM